MQEFISHKEYLYRLQIDTQVEGFKIYLTTIWIFFSCRSNQIGIDSDTWKVASNFDSRKNVEKLEAKSQE